MDGTSGSVTWTLEVVICSGNPMLEFEGEEVKNELFSDMKLKADTASAVTKLKAYFEPQNGRRVSWMPEAIIYRNKYS